MDSHEFDGLIDAYKYAQLDGDFDTRCEARHALKAAFRELEAERDALRADAERYRWLKEGAEITFREQQSWPIENGKLIYSCCPSWDEYDKAIDDAIAAKGAQS